jgi:RimJ/RimL family protein N-acetyltransferase
MNSSPHANNADSAPLTLIGTRVQLVPLSLEQSNAYRTLLSREQLDKLWYTLIPKPDDVEAEIKRRLNLASSGSMVPFCVKNALTGEVCGMTTFMNVDAVNKRLEIGSTWLSYQAQRSGINTQMKYLMLEYAFERLMCIAVEFRTHFMNHASRAAIERLGAKLDGVLRSHQIMPDGTLRDTCVYSITRAEWPTVKRHLTYLQSKYEDRSVEVHRSTPHAD